MSYREMNVDDVMGRLLSQQSEITSLKAEVAMLREALSELYQEALYQAQNNGWDNRYELPKAAEALSQSTSDYRKEIEEAVKEQCADVCEKLSNQWPIANNHFDACADAIRSMEVKR